MLMLNLNHLNLVHLTTALANHLDKKRLSRTMIIMLILRMKIPSMRFDPSKKDQHVTCAICKRKTKHYCWGCHRYLCSEPPQNGKDLHSMKFPKNFSVKVPKVKEDGTLERDNKGYFIFQTERGGLSCYHIAHHEYWKNNYENKPIISAVSEGTEESLVESNK